MMYKKRHLRDYLMKENEDDHYVSLKVLTRRLETDLQNGLTSAQANSLLKKDGPNSLHPSSRLSRFSVRGMFEPFTLILLITAISSFIIYGIHFYQKSFSELDYIYYGFILLLVAVLNGCTYTFQLKTEANTLNTFKVMWPTSAYVIRDGLREMTPVARIVKGDIVEMYAGKRIPADVRLIVANNFKVDNSLITRNKTPLHRSTNSTDSNPLRSENMAFFGTQCVEGYARGIVLATGNFTVIGRIAKLISILDNETEPPLEHEIAKFEKRIFLLVGFGTTAFTAFFFLFKFEFLDGFIYWVAMVVGNIPEGLIPTVGLVLIVMAKRLANINCIIKHMMVVDTLGLTSAICIGKTGILTMNKIAVSHVWMDNEIYAVGELNNETGYENYMLSSSWFEFSRGAMLSNSAEFSRNEKTKENIQDMKCSGDELDIAILKFTEEKVGNVMNYMETNKRVFELPFNPTNSYSITVHRICGIDGEVQYMMYVKGAPDLLWDKCSTILLNGKTIEMDAGIHASILEGFESLGKRGETPIGDLTIISIRLLTKGLFDYCLPVDEYPPNQSFELLNIHIPAKGLRFLGMVSLSDPPKLEMVDSISKCRQAGIKVILCTGAHATTARAIAEETGIITTARHVSHATDLHDMKDKKIEFEETKAAVVDGQIFNSLREGDLDKLLNRHSELIFARITPHQEFLVVDTLQSEGYVVAVTGQSIIDVVSVKKANIGIAMGICGCDAVNEAADLVLLDNNFQNIVDGIEIGRLFFYNLKKVVAYSLCQHMPETIPFFINILCEFPMPLLSKAFLCMNIGIDILPTVCLGFEKAEYDLMFNREPYGRNRCSLLSSRMLFRTYFLIGVCQTAAAYLANFMVVAEDGFLEDKIWGIKFAWDSRAINDLQDSYGQEWTYKHRKDLADKGQTAFFITVVVMQLINAVMSSSFRLSIFQHGMKNWYLNASLVFSLCLAIMMIHIPPIRIFLHTWPLQLHIWLVGVLFGLMLFTFQEVSLCYLRHLPPDSWFEKELTG